MSIIIKILAHLGIQVFQIDYKSRLINQNKVTNTSYRKNWHGFFCVSRYIWIDID